MTALTKYRKLESRGLWRELPEAQRREVVVNLGDSSLILTDPRSDVALTHWSLPAVTRLDSGGATALYAPGDDATETLEIEDADMIAALDTVHSAILSVQPRPGRLRGATLVAGTVAVLAAAMFLLPDALVSHTASALPPAARAEIGRLALADLTRIAGAPCAAPAGQGALDRLAVRVFGPMPPRLVVLREGVTGATHLPGNQIVLSEALLAVPDGPEVAAGHALAEALRSAGADPLRPVLRHAGLVATLRLLATGSLPEGALAGYAETLLRAEPAPAAPEPLLERFRLAGVPSTPYAYALDPTGEATLALIEADPFPTGPPRPILPDDDWVSLQDICTQ